MSENENTTVTEETLVDESLPEGHSKEIIYHDLPAKPTREELADLALQDGELWRRKCVVEAERKRVMNEFKDDIDNLDTLRNDVMKKISGQDLTTVKCEVEKNAEGKVIRVVRVDTGEEVEDVQQIKLGIGAEGTETEQDAGTMDEGCDQHISDAEQTDQGVDGQTGGDLE